MWEGIPTLDDYSFTGKTTLVRVDINSPLDPETGEILDDRRIKLHQTTLNELIEKGSRVVILAHQGRPGSEDFTPLDKHAEKLAGILKREVKYIDSVFNSRALDEIKAMGNGEVILLENVRFYSEELMKAPPEDLAKTIMVKRLSSVADIYVNDAFAAAHRGQASLVGFPMVMESAAGRLMERELSTIAGVLKNPKKPVSFILGGVKVDDSLKIAKKALEEGIDSILPGGVVMNVFLSAKGHDIGEKNMEFIRKKKLEDQIQIAKDLLQSYGEKIQFPVDLALDKDGERQEISLEELPQEFIIADLGHKTVEKFREIILNSGTVFANGAMGIFEEKNFAYGTEETIKAIADSEGFSVMGGGHTVAAAEKLQVEDRITHISSGGGACINLLAGYELPAVEVLRKG